ncbi:hypothetical protein [Haloarchaeobius sp. TZWWS8]|uniref:hypothetical protein n=1 Tax=Haloarchaeobius sp. TZWWS8 TaxID=3446121 RepID=UPI003EBC6CCF
MQRRRFLVSAAAAATGTAGCLGRLTGDESSRERDSLATPESTRGTTNQPDSQQRPAPQLEVLSTVSGSLDVRFKLVRVADLTTMYDRRRRLSYAERVYLSGVLDRDTDYQLYLYVENEFIFERTVHAGERLVLEIDAPESVALVEHRRLDET